MCWMEISEIIIPVILAEDAKGFRKKDEKFEWKREKFYGGLSYILIETS